MPTPFMHLQIAEQIILSLEGDDKNGSVLPCLQQEWSAFYLGSIAPDVNSVSDIKRETTHFYAMPPAPELHAHQEMLQQYPQLADTEALSPATAVFLAAYQAHLLLDLVWLREIVYPYFVQNDNFESREQRWLTHFILLTYLDTLALEALPKTAVYTLATAQTNHLLPFIGSQALTNWRDMIVEQLQPNAPIKTIEIYAERIGISPEEFAANLHDQMWMSAQVFDKIPVDEVQKRLTEAVPSSIKIISDYLQIN